MLIDELIAFPDSKAAADVSAILPAYRALGRKVQEAHRYVLNRDATLMIHHVTESSPRRFLSALSICRLPFPKMWVEFVFKDRSDWMAEATKRGVRPVNIDDASPPSRLGFYLEQQGHDGRTIMIQPVWSHPQRQTLSICQMVLKIDTGPDGGSDPLTPEEKEAALRQYKNTADRKNPWTRWTRDPDELEAAFDLESRISMVIPDYLRPMWAELVVRAPQKDVQHLHDLARYDLMSEWRFVLALLTTLNSRNVISYSDEMEFKKLNKHRLKKGSAPLQSYREIKLSLSRVQRNRLGTGSHIDLEMHIVHGHWKLRSSGLWWWNPHVRGNIGERPPIPTTVVKG